MKIIITVTLFIVLPWNIAAFPSRLKKDEMALLRSFGYENAEMSKKLIENGTNARIEDSVGRTPMHLASENGWYEIVQLLIDRGYTYQIRVTDEGLRIPLDWAVNNDHPNVTELLIKSGSDVNHRSRPVWPLNSAVCSELWTPLHAASWAGHVDVMRVLIQNGGDVHATALCLQQPIHLAAFTSNVNAMRLLIQSGSYVDARDSANQTPLHLAVKFGGKDVVELLIWKGANIRAKDRFGETPGDYALRRGPQFFD